MIIIFDQKMIIRAIKNRVKQDVGIRGQKKRSSFFCAQIVIEYRHVKYAKGGTAMSKPVTGTTRLLALIGSPVSHSLSPEMMNYACQLLGLDYMYVAFDVSRDRVPAALEAMRTLGIRGFNVTMPCKIEAFRCADRLSPAAGIIGACNTLVNDGGTITGHITDGEGYVNMLRSEGVEIRGRKITVAGGGGAAAAIQVQCALDGARAVTIFQRRSATLERALETADKIRAACPDCEVRVCDPQDRDLLRREIGESDIFANGTSVGMQPNADASFIEDPSMFRPGLVVTDAVYDPVETKLLADAKKAGCLTIGGKGMLLWQGVSAFRLFTGHDMPVEEIRRKFFL